MECKNCGAATSVKTYYCGGCGRPVSFEPMGVATEEEPPAEIGDVPAPGPSLEPIDLPPIPTTPPVPHSPRGASLPPAPPAPPDEFESRKALCSLCMGSFPDTSLSYVEGMRYCSDCNPMKVRRVEHPGVGVEPAPVVDSGPVFKMYEGPEDKVAGGGMRVVLGLLVLVMIVGVVLASVSLLGSDRIDKLMAGVELGRTDARLLTHKYEQGAELAYTISMSADIGLRGLLAKRFLLGGGGDIEMSMSMLGNMRARVLSVDENGNARLSVTIEGMTPTMSVQVDGNEFPMGPDGFGAMPSPQTQRFELEVDPFGELISTSEEGGDFSDLLNGGFKGMPRRELKVGDTWTAEETLPNDMAEFAGITEPTLKATYRVEGYKKVRGRDCAVISIVAEMDGLGGMAGSAPPGMELDVEMDADMKGVVFFDVEAGVMVQCAMDVQMDMSMVVGPESADASGVVRIDINLQ